MAMGTGGDQVVARVSPRPRRHVAVALATCLALAGLVLVYAAPVAHAADYPGASQVRAAQQAVRNQSATVAQLDAAIAQLEDATQVAEEAMLASQEKYTEMQQANIDAQRQLFAANNRADEAQRSLDDARSNLAVIAMAEYRDGGSLASFQAIMTSTGFEDVIARSDALNRASDQASVVIDQVRAAELVARTMRQYAQQAADTAVQAEQDARDAYAEALQAANDAQTALNDAQATRLEAVARLAQLQHTSAALEAQRQQGLTSARQQRAEAQAQLLALQAAFAAQQAAGGTGSTEGVDVTPIGGVSVGTAAQGQIAVAFALSQLGKPYVYGTAGPNTYDCSGLTMVSWRVAGVSLPRSSKGQYNYLGKVPYAALRQGDLIFWGTNAQANAVYHVTMYIGNNFIVEASRPGVPVKTRDYRLWLSSNRMPWAGRP